MNPAKTCDLTQRIRFLATSLRITLVDLHCSLPVEADCSWERMVCSMEPCLNRASERICIHDYMKTDAL